MSDNNDDCNEILLTNNNESENYDYTDGESNICTIVVESNDSGCDDADDSDDCNEILMT